MNQSSDFDKLYHAFWVLVRGGASPSILQAVIDMMAINVLYDWDEILLSVCIDEMRMGND